MSEVRVGVGLDPVTGVDGIPEQARRAEQLGFDLVSCGEHVFFHSPAANAFVVLAAAAGATERIELLSSLTIVPIYPAGLVAKMAATLDHVSGGRFNLGVGVGGEFPAEFRACGVDPAERGARTGEALEVLSRLFAGEKLNFDGKFASFDGLELDPPPARRGGPPIWIGGRKAPAMRRAAAYASVWLPYMVTPSRLRDSLEQVRARARERGRTPDGVRGAVFVWGMVDRDGARARRTAIEAVSATYNQDFSPLADKYLPSGTPDDVAGRLHEYVDAGAETVVFAPACPPDRRAEAVELFATEVVPLLRRA